MQVRSLGQEDHLEKETANHSSIRAWEIPMDRGAWQATLHEVTKSQSQLNNSAQHRWAVSAQVQPGEGSLCRVSHWRTGALLLEGGGALSPQNCVAPGDRAAD